MLVDERRVLGVGRLDEPSTTLDPERVEANGNDLEPLGMQFFA